jgi:hypothetical protein
MAAYLVLISSGGRVEGTAGVAVVFLRVDKQHRRRGGYDGLPANLRLRLVTRRVVSQVASPFSLPCCRGGVPIAGRSRAGGLLGGEVRLGGRASPADTGNMRRPIHTPRVCATCSSKYGLRDEHEGCWHRALLSA